MTSDIDNKVFKSFMMGGFESACHINNKGDRLDMIASTQHDVQVNEDYALVKTEGIHTVRDGVRWPLIEKQPGVYDFSSLEPMVEAAKKQGVQVIWTMCHYGWPNDLDVFSPEFVTRFAAFSTAVATFIHERCADVPIYTPVNEISFLAWAAGDVGWIHPYAKDRGGELKKQLVRAALACMDAVWAIDPRARFVHVDPIISVVPRPTRPRRVREAKAFHELQFQASDMIAGRLHPELGGDIKYLDIMGANFYHDNQWAHGGRKISWYDNPRSKQWVPLHQLVERIYKRYGRPMMLGETSHVGIHRPAWMREIIEEVQKIQELNIPFLGICLYPIIDRHDWENNDHWHNSGLWDYIPDGTGHQKRTLYKDYVEEVRRARSLFDKQI